MICLKRVCVFLLSFLILSLSIAGVCAAVDDEAQTDALEETLFSVDETEAEELIEEPDTPNSRTADLADSAASSYSPRLTAPAKTNGYYYSDNNIFYQTGWGMPNCTCYAYGRAYEILKKKPNLCIYSAYLWYDYNKQNGYYAYGTTPKLGAIACWVYSSGTSGHVAVVEKIENGKITFSNSAYGGTEFYTTTAPVSDPSNGNKTWIFQGYIYIGSYTAQPTVSPTTVSENISEAVNVTGDIYRITAKAGVNLRTNAGTSYPSQVVIPNGTQVVVTKTKSAGGYHWGLTTYKKKVGWFVLSYAKLVSSYSTSSLKRTDYLIGDVDGDGKVSITDATMIQRVMAKVVPVSDYIRIVGDFDGNSVLEVHDATRLQVSLTK